MRAFQTNPSFSRKALRGKKPGDPAAPVHPVEMRVLDERARGFGLPAYHSSFAAGLDLVACIDAPISLRPGATVLIPTGLALLPRRADVVGLILPRSGLGHKRGLVMGNGTGVIDSDYTGPLFVSAHNRLRTGLRFWRSDRTILITPGMRIAQLVFVPMLQAAITEVAEFSKTTLRGAGAFGSTGH